MGLQTTEQVTPTVSICWWFSGTIIHFLYLKKYVSFFIEIHRKTSVLRKVLCRSESLLYFIFSILSSITMCLGHWPHGRKRRPVRLVPGRKDDFLFVLHAAAAAHHPRGGDHGGDVPRDAHHRAAHLHLCAGAERGPGAQHDRRQVKQDKDSIISVTGDRL